MLTHLNASPLPPARVVILGARGFIAHALAASLQADGIEICVVASRDIDLSAPTAVGRLRALLRPEDALVMTAGLTPEKGLNAENLIKNVSMAEQLAQALAAVPCRHLIYISSESYYGWQQSPLAETLPPSPEELYGLMHVTRELIFAQVAQASHIPYAILRPAVIYGPGNTHNNYGPNRFIGSALAEGKIRLFGAGEETRDHVFIGDVTALVGLILRHRSIGVLNGSSGTFASFAEVAGLVAQLCGRNVTIEYQPRTVAITHRYSDPTELYRSFPQHRPATLEFGLQATLREMTLRG